MATTKKTTAKTAPAKTAPVKEEPVKKTVAKAEPAKTVAAAAKKAEPAKTENVKVETVKKAEPVKKAPVKKAAPKKVAPKKVAPKKPVPVETKVNFFVEYAGAQVPVEEVIKNVKATYGKDAKEISIYLKPEESKAYFGCRRQRRRDGCILLLIAINFEFKTQDLKTAQKSGLLLFYDECCEKS